MIRKTAVLALVFIACSTRAPRRTAPTPRGRAGDRVVRVALAAPNQRVGATSAFQWIDTDTRALVARGRAGDQWRVERENPGARVRAVRSDGARTAWLRGLVAGVTNEGFITLNDRRYRGEVAILPVDTSVVIVNRVGVEDYLRGVVAVEMGSRPPGDSAALQAQAVASRSFAIAHSGDAGAVFDVRASTVDQAYGGVDVENDAASAAIDATRGLVLRYQGRVVDAPFHSACGGSTAEVNEVWRSPGPPYLQRVSDRVPGTDRLYCDIAPRFRWSRTLTRRQLDADLDLYLRTYATVPRGRPGSARVIGVRSRTRSGRVETLDIETDRGIFALRGNDIRYVLRAPGGEILASTYFSVEPEYRDGVVSRVTLRGQGSGHGVGMCQWGAIGRARAGYSFRSILGTYYPGTTVGPVSSE